MKLLQTKEYLLLIDEEAPIHYGRHIFKLSTEELDIAQDGWTGELHKDWKRVIAYWPLVSSAKALSLPLLPDPVREIDIEGLAEETKEYQTYNQYDPSKGDFVYGFQVGYKAAQPKQFSLGNIKKAIEMARESYNPMGNGDSEWTHDEDQIIQSLSTQQLPKEFKIEYNHCPNMILPEYICTIGCDECQMKKEIKTIINPEGKEEICGTYKY